MLFLRLISLLVQLSTANDFFREDTIEIGPTIFTPMARVSSTTEQLCLTDVTTSDVSGEVPSLSTELYVFCGKTQQYSAVFKKAKTGGCMEESIPFISVLKPDEDPKLPFTVHWDRFFSHTQFSQVSFCRVMRLEADWRETYQSASIKDTTNVYAYLQGKKTPMDGRILKMDLLTGEILSIINWPINGSPDSSVSGMVATIRGTPKLIFSTSEAPKDGYDYSIIIFDLSSNRLQMNSGYFRRPIDAFEVAAHGYMFVGTSQYSSDQYRPVIVPLNSESLAPQDGMMFFDHSDRYPQQISFSQFLSVFSGGVSKVIAFMHYTEIVATTNLWGYFSVVNGDLSNLPGCSSNRQQSFSLHGPVSGPGKIRRSLLFFIDSNGENKLLVYMVEQDTFDFYIEADNSIGRIVVLNYPLNDEMTADFCTVPAGAPVFEKIFLINYTPCTSIPSTLCFIGPGQILPPRNPGFSNSFSMLISWDILFNSEYTVSSHSSSPFLQALNFYSEPGAPSTFFNAQVVTSGLDDFTWTVLSDQTVIAPGSNGYQETAFLTPGTDPGCTSLTQEEFRAELDKLMPLPITSGQDSTYTMDIPIIIPISDGCLAAFYLKATHVQSGANLLSLKEYSSEAEMLDNLGLYFADRREGHSYYKASIKAVTENVGITMTMTFHVANREVFSLTGNQLVYSFDLKFVGCGSYEPTITNLDGKLTNGELVIAVSNDYPGYQTNVLISDLVEVVVNNECKFRPGSLVGLCNDFTLSADKQTIQVTPGTVGNTCVVGIVFDCSGNQCHQGQTFQAAITFRFVSCDVSFTYPFDNPHGISATVGNDDTTILAPLSPSNPGNYLPSFCSLPLRLINTETGLEETNLYFTDFPDWQLKLKGSSVITAAKVYSLKFDLQTTSGSPYWPSEPDKIIKVYLCMATPTFITAAPDAVYSIKSGSHTIPFSRIQQAISMNNCEFFQLRLCPQGYELQSECTLTASSDGIMAITDEVGESGITVDTDLAEVKNNVGGGTDYVVVLKFVVGGQSLFANQKVLFQCGNQVLDFEWVGGYQQHVFPSGASVSSSTLWTFTSDIKNCVNDEVTLYHDSDRVSKYANGQFSGLASVGSLPIVESASHQITFNFLGQIAGSYTFYISYRVQGVRESFQVADPLKLVVCGIAIVPDEANSPWLQLQFTTYPGFLECTELSEPKMLPRVSLMDVCSADPPLNDLLSYDSSNAYQLDSNLAPTSTVFNGLDESSQALISQNAQGQKVCLRSSSSPFSFSRRYYTSISDVADYFLRVNVSFCEPEFVTPEGFSRRSDGPASQQFFTISIGNALRQTPTDCSLGVAYYEIVDATIPDTVSVSPDKAILSIDSFKIGFSVLEGSVRLVQESPEGVRFFEKLVPLFYDQCQYALSPLVPEALELSFTITLEEQSEAEEIYSEPVSSLFEPLSSACAVLEYSLCKDEAGTPLDKVLGGYPFGFSSSGFLTANRSAIAGSISKFFIRAITASGPHSYLAYKSIQVKISSDINQAPSFMEPLPDMLEIDSVATPEFKFLTPSIVDFEGHELQIELLAPQNLSNFVQAKLVGDQAELIFLASEAIAGNYSVTLKLSDKGPVPQFPREAKLVVSILRPSPDSPEEEDYGDENGIEVAQLNKLIEDFRRKNNLGDAQQSSPTVRASVDATGEGVITFSEEMYCPVDLTAVSHEYFLRVAFTSAISGESSTSSTKPNTQRRRLLSQAFSFEITSHQPKEIGFKIKFEEPGIVSNSIYARDKLTIRFAHPEVFIVRESGQALTPEAFMSGTFQIEVPIPQQIRPEVKKAISGATEQVGRALNTLGASNFFLMLIMNGSMQQLWGLIRSLQLIILASLMNLQFPANAAVFYQGAIMFANMDLLSGEALYEKLFVFKETPPLSLKFDELDFPDMNFIMNSGSILIVLGLILVEPALMAIINLLCLKLSRFRWSRRIGVLTYRKRPLKLLASALIRLILESYLELAICTALNLLAFFKFSEEIEEFFMGFDNLLSSALTLFTLGLLLFFPYWAWKQATFKINSRPQDAEPSVFTDDLNTSSLAASAYQVLYMLRRLLVVFILTVMKNATFFQCQTMITISWAMLNFISTSQPFASPSVNRIEAFNELTIFMSLSLINSFLNAEVSLQLREALGWVLIGIVSLNILVNLFLVGTATISALIDFFYGQYKLSKAEQEMKRRISNREYFSKLFPSALGYFSQIKAEYEAKEFCREWNLHRTWLLENNRKVEAFPEEIRFQELISKFQFAAKAKAVHTFTQNLDAAQQRLKYKQMATVHSRIRKRLGGRVTDRSEPGSSRRSHRDHRPRPPPTEVRELARQLGKANCPENVLVPHALSIKMDFLNQVRKKFETGNKPMPERLLAAIQEEEEFKQPADVQGFMAYVDDLEFAYQPSKRDQEFIYGKDKILQKNTRRPPNLVGERPEAVTLIHLLLQVEPLVNGTSNSSPILQALQDLNNELLSKPGAKEVSASSVEALLNFSSEHTTTVKCLYHVLGMLQNECEGLLPAIFGISKQTTSLKLSDKRELGLPTRQASVSTSNFLVLSVKPDPTMEVQDLSELMSRSLEGRNGKRRSFSRLPKYLWVALKSAQDQEVDLGTILSIPEQDQAGERSFEAIGATCSAGTSTCLKFGPSWFRNSEVTSDLARVPASLILYKS